MKAYTDLSQSKKLAEILPLKSADMYYYTINGNSEWYKTPNILENIDDLDMDGNSIPCWSLAALIELLPPVYTLKPMIDLEENSIYYSGHNTLYTNDDTLIDACINMIFKLNEQNLM